MTAFEHIQVHPVATALGAEISGVDLTQPLQEPVLKEIYQAWMEHQVLFLRDQDITIDQHKAFARSYGELHEHPVLRQLEDQGHPEVVVLESNEKLPFVADSWHSDVTFEQCPPMGSILHGVIIPDHGGDTMWASMYAAYEGLSDQMQRLLSSLEAEHDGGGFNAIATSDEQKKDLASRQKAVHPVIRTHPETGRKGIFVNTSFTQKIVGMKTAESQTLLGFLYDHVTKPEHICRLRWQPNTIAMWDNRCTQHKVVADNLSAHRKVHRVTLLGDKPFLDA